MTQLDNSSEPSHPMQVRRATVADVPQMAKLNVETWRAAYRGQLPDAILNGLDVERRAIFWRERIAQERGVVLVVESGGSVLGYCDFIPSRDRDADPGTIAEIAAIYVLPEHWRKGAGRALCQGALAMARSRRYQVVTLWVLASNSTAKHFYEAMGFCPDTATKTEKTADGYELHEVRFRTNI